MHTKNINPADSQLKVSMLLTIALRPRSPITSSPEGFFQRRAAVRRSRLFSAGLVTILVLIAGCAKRVVHDSTGEFVSNSNKELLVDIRHTGYEVLGNLYSADKCSQLVEELLKSKKYRFLRILDRKNSDIEDEKLIAALREICHKKGIKGVLETPRDSVPNLIEKL